MFWYFSPFKQNKTKTCVNSTHLATHHFFLLFYIYLVWTHLVIKKDTLQQLLIMLIHQAENIILDWFSMPKSDSNANWDPLWSLLFRRLRFGLCFCFLGNAVVSVWKPVPLFGIHTCNCQYMISVGTFPKNENHISNIHCIVLIEHLISQLSLNLGHHPATDISFWGGECNLLLMQQPPSQPSI